MLGHGSGEHPGSISWVAMVVGGGGDLEFGCVIEGDWERRAGGLEAVGRGRN